MKPSRITKRNPSTDSDLKDSDSDSVPGTHCLEGSSAMSTDPPIIGPLPVKDCPLELNLSIAMPPQSLDSQATPTASQVTPTTSAQATPNIPLATPINITSFSSTTTNSFCSLLNRHVAADMYPSLPALKRQLYSLPSMVQRLALERRLQEHEGCVNCINFSWAGNLLASGSDDLQVVLWDWAKGKPVSKFASGHVANVFQAKFMPHCGDSVLVTAARDGQVMYSVVNPSGELNHSKRVGHHNDSAHKLSIEPDSPNVLLSCGEDGVVLQIDLREPESARNKILTCKNEKNRRISLYSIFIDPSDLHYFAVSGRDQWARIYDRRLLRQDADARDAPMKRYCPHHLMRPENDLKRANVTCLVYSHDGKELLCSYNDEDIYLFNTTHSTEADSVHKYTGHRNSATVKGVNFFGLGSEYITSGSDCGNVFLWDKNSEKIVQYMEGDYEGVVNCLEPHPHIPVLATSGLDHDVKIFSPRTAELTRLEGLSEVVERNKSSRQEAWDASPSDGYEVIMEFIMRQYRRGLRERIGIQEDEDSDDSFMDTPPNEGNGNEDSEEDEEGEGGGAAEEEGRRLRRCIQQ